MAKIFVPAMLPGEIDRYIESDGKNDVKIRTWPDGTTEFDRGGMAILLGPGEIHEIGKVSRKDAPHNNGTGVNGGAKAAAPGLADGAPQNRDENAKNQIRDLETALRSAGLYAGPRVHGEEDGVWGRKANLGLEKVLVWAQLQSGEEISGSLTPRTHETLRKMADAGKIHPQLVGAIERLQASGQLDQHYGPKDVQAVAHEIRENPLVLGEHAGAASGLPMAALPSTAPRLT